MITKIVKIVEYIVFSLSALVILLFFILDLNVLNVGLDLMKDMSADMKVLELNKLSASWSALILNFSGGLFVLSAVSALAFAVYQFVAKIVDNPKSAISSGLALVGVAALILVSYALASSEIPASIAAKGMDVSASTSKWIETFLYVMYFFMGLAVFTLLYHELSKIWK